MRSWVYAKMAEGHLYHVEESYLIAADTTVSRQRVLENIDEIRQGIFETAFWT